MKSSHNSLSAFTHSLVSYWQPRSLFTASLFLQWEWMWLRLSFCLTSPFVSHRTKKAIRVWNGIKVSKHDRLLISSWTLRIYHRVVYVETILHVTWPVMPVMMATFLFVLPSPFTSPLAAAHWAIFWSWFRFGVCLWGLDTLCATVCHERMQTSETPAAWATHQEPALSSQSQSRAPVTCAPQNKEERNRDVLGCKCVTAPT